MKSQKAEQTTNDAIKKQKSNKRGDKCLVKFTSSNGSVYGSLTLDIRKAGDYSQPIPVAEAPKAEAPVPPAVPFKLELSDDQIARLRKMAPKSVAKIKNTLATQFHIGDVVGTVAALAEKGLYKIDGNHIDWPSEPAEA